MINILIPYLLATFINGHPGITGNPAGESNQEIPGDPLYMLTYDHGGLILWGTDHFEERLDNAVEWLDKYPDFKIGLDNEAFVYDYLNEHDPELLKKLQDYLKKYEGRFEIGSCTYGQPLSTFITGESNIRQIKYALEANKKYFNYENSIYLMSEHAMHAQIPQILNAFGFDGAIMRTHYMMYGYNPTYDHSFGWWKGMDGSKIPTIPTYVNEGAAFGRTPVDNWILTRYPSEEATESPADFRKQFSHINPLLATRADDSDLRKEALVKEYSGDPDYRWILLDEIMSIYPEPETEFNTAPDDFTVRMPWGYCGNVIWNKSREAEISVLTTERLAALDFILNGESHEKDLDEAWKHILLAQHHDIQIVGLIPDAHEHLDRSLNLTRNMQKTVLQKVARHLSGNGNKQVTVFNPLSWPGSQWIETEASFDRDEARDVEVYCGEEKVPSGLIEVNRYSSGNIMSCKIKFLARFDRLGLKSYSIVPVSTHEDFLEADLSVDKDNLEIQTPFYKLKLNEGGGIHSLIDSGSGKSVFSTDTRSAYLAGRIEGKEEKSGGRWILSNIHRDSPQVTATEYGFIADIPYNMTLTLDSRSPRIDFKITVQLDSQRIGRLSDNPRESTTPFIHEDKLRFKFFPLLDGQVRGVRDLPFVIAETEDKYIQGNYWTGVEGTNSGISVLNKGNMALVREKDGGVSVPLTYAMYYIWGTRMLQGEFSYQFALYPYEGTWKVNDIHKHALSYNFPFLSAESKPTDGSYGNQVELLDIDAGNLVLSALYVDKGEIFVRMYDYLGEASETGINNLMDKKYFVETDLKGNEIRRINNEVDFNPWQFKTFKMVE